MEGSHRSDKSWNITDGFTNIKNVEAKKQDEGANLNYT